VELSVDGIVDENRKLFGKNAFRERGKFKSGIVTEDVEDDDVDEADEDEDEDAEAVVAVVVVVVVAARDEARTEGETAQLGRSMFMSKVDWNMSRADDVFEVFEGSAGKHKLEESNGFCVAFLSRRLEADAVDTAAEGGEDWVESGSDEVNAVEDALVVYGGTSGSINGEWAEGGNTGGVVGGWASDSQ
jgi:hypothetical protein